jgi:hypothetical protein
MKPERAAGRYSFGLFHFRPSGGATGAVHKQLEN